MAIPLLPPHAGARSNTRNDVSDGGPSAVETKPVKIDWDFAQRELKDATARNNDNLANIGGADKTNDNIAGGGLAEQERNLDVDENASAKPEIPEQREEDVAQQPQLAAGASRVECEGEQKGDAPPLDGGPVEAAPELSGLSEMMGKDTSSSPGALSGEMTPAESARSAEMSQTGPAPAPTPGAAAVEEPAPSAESTNEHEERSTPQTQSDVSAPSPSPGMEPPSAAPVPPEPSPKCDPPLATAAVVPTEEDSSSMTAGAPVAQAAELQKNEQEVSQPSEKCDVGEPPTDAELPNANSDDERGKVNRPASSADATQDDGRRVQDTPAAPAPPPPPLPPPLPPPSPKAGVQNMAELIASSKAVHVNKATLMELQRAREAWRGAEGELERSQEERDELRATLQAVGTMTSVQQ